MKIRAVRDFDDYEVGVKRIAGDEWEVTESRFEAINATQWGILAEVVEDKQLSALSKRELLNYAKEIGVEVDKSATKPQIIELLEGSQAE